MTLIIPKGSLVSNKKTYCKINLNRVRIVMANFYRNSSEPCWQNCQDMVYVILAKWQCRHYNIKICTKRRKISKHTGKLARKDPAHTDQIKSRKHVENTSEMILILENCAETVQNTRANCIENTQTTY
jgi:hypothetical protein